MNRQERRAAASQQRAERRSHGLDVDHNEGALDRRHMYEHNAPALPRFLHDAIDAGVGERGQIVLMILDINDKLAAQIAGYAGADVEGMRRKYEGSGMAPTIFMPMRIDGAIEGFRSTHPSIAQQIEGGLPDPSYTWVVVMACGGSTLIAAEIEPEAPSAEVN